MVASEMEVVKLAMMTREDQVDRVIEVMELRLRYFQNQALLHEEQLRQFKKMDAHNLTREDQELIESALSVAGSE